MNAHQGTLPRNVRIALVVLLLGATVGVLVWWTAGRDRSSNNLRPVRIRLGWLVNANSAGQVVALEKGFYRKEGLDVELGAGGLASPSVRTVATKQDDMGFANGPDLVIKARADGAPFRIVAVIQQSSYHGFFVRENSSIHTPTDWKGRSVGIKQASPTFLLYRALCTKLDVDRDSIKEIPLGYGTQLFMDGEIEVYPGAITNEAISIERHGVPLRIIRPSDYGIDSCGNVLFAREETIKNDPDLVRRVVRATLRGWRWASETEHAEAVLDMLAAHNPKVDREKERQALKETLALVNEGEKIGQIPADKIEQIIKNLAEFGVIERPIPVKFVIDDQFLD